MLLIAGCLACILTVATPLPPCLASMKTLPSYLLPDLKCHVGKYHWWNLMESYACALAAKNAREKALNS